MNRAQRRPTRRGLGLALVGSILGLGLACADDTSEVAVSIRPQEILESPHTDLRILDVRTQEEYASGHVPGALHIPHDEVATRLEEVGADRDRTLVVYCERGGRAMQAEEALRAAGYTDVRHLEGDMRGWREAGLPVVRR